jgi:hypothetical protein
MTDRLPRYRILDAVPDTASRISRGFHRIGLACAILTVLPAFFVASAISATGTTPIDKGGLFVAALVAPPLLTYVVVGFLGWIVNGFMQ